MLFSRRHCPSITQEVWVFLTIFGGRPGAPSNLIDPRARQGRVSVRPWLSAVMLYFELRFTGSEATFLFPTAKCGWEVVAGRTTIDWFLAILQGTDIFGGAKRQEIIIDWCIYFQDFG